MKKPSLVSLFAPLAVILSFGLTTIWSTIPSLFVSQIVFVLVGTLLFLVTSLADRQSLRSLAWASYILCISLLIVTYFVGSISRGSMRWIDIGPFRFQSSEFSKPLLILAFSGIFSGVKVKSRLAFVKAVVLVAIPSALIFFEPDLGSALVIAAIGLALIVFSGMPIKYLLVLLIASAAVSPVLYRVMHDYQKQRLTSFINPYSDPKRSGYNVIQATIAVGSGQLIGTGVRQGTQSHLKFLPERHTDFAFASFAEEFGFIGVLVMFGCFYLVLNWLVRNSWSQADPFARLISLGALTMFSSQTVVNIGMNLGVMPVTGITLPFVSYGGSSLLSSFIVLGIVYASTKSKFIEN